MPRWKKPTKEEVRENRSRLSERAATGELRFPSAVVEIRKSLGLTQAQFSTIAGITKRQVLEIETGKANPTIETLERIARLFGFTVGFVPKEPASIRQSSSSAPRR
ncbi:helix-turn-helix domain-containing protein [Rhizobium sp. BK176]|uniref:helix-turn-helix domain-containing protein n=1 Tax=Rhizobium sp. BK176 TaxID=2587071 RepID=UPI002167CD2B|nr:helix-turn-helix transcriptional regulator [Rhizobium sp. BK176]MCS4089224.1 transcriptional regulator with XRE-family HTH domain [Rhizobium sp. BK176]